MPFVCNDGVASNLLSLAIIGALYSNRDVRVGVAAMARAMRIANAWSLL